jgi:hypothetical protein
MSDMVRTAVLLASHASVSDVIAGEVAARVKPAPGVRIPLTALSSRIAKGMPVMLYQGGQLAAKAVVDDLDSRQVMARITTVFQEDVVIEKSAHVQFLNEEPTSTLKVKSSLGKR